MSAADSGGPAPPEGPPRRRRRQLARVVGESSLPAPTAPPPPPVVDDADDSGEIPRGAGVPRSHRQRRSAVQMPALVSRADIPDDAEGRVEFIVSTVRPSEPAAAPPAEPHAELLPAMREGSPVPWLMVAIIAAVLVVVFIVGMRFTH